MVDAVMSFEGEGSHQFRILRALKNRFGPTDEIGVFEMTGGGFAEIANPSELFLSGRELGSSRHRRVRGYRRHPPAAGGDAGAGRADLARHAAPRGGRVGSEPAVDGACGAGSPLRGEALRPRRLSQCRRRTAHPGTGGRSRRRCRAGLITANAPLPTDGVYFGEVSLSGALRPVSSTREARLKEAAKLGFSRAVYKGCAGRCAPAVGQRRIDNSPGEGHGRIPMSTLGEVGEPGPPIRAQRPASVPGQRRLPGEVNGMVADEGGVADGHVLPQPTGGVGENDDAAPGPHRRSAPPWATTAGMCPLVGVGPPQEHQQAVTNRTGSCAPPRCAPATRGRREPGQVSDRRTSAFQGAQPVDGRAPARPQHDGDVVALHPGGGPQRAAAEVGQGVPVSPARPGRPRRRRCGSRRRGLG